MKFPCFYLQKNGSRVLHVSKNEGHAWNAAQLPMIGKQEFYSLLDMSEDMVFVHVDTPGGKIVLFVFSGIFVLLLRQSAIRARLGVASHLFTTPR